MNGRGRPTSLFLLWAIALLPFSWTCLNQLLVDRPYWLFEVDDGVFYYWSRVVALDVPLGSTPHPGITAILLGAGLIKIIGPSLDRVQLFYDVWGIGAALLTGGALAYGFRQLCKEMPAVWSLVAITSVLTWPTLMTYTDYLGTDSLIVAVGLPPLCMTWRAIHSPEWSPGRTSVIGIWLGIAISTKFSFIPVILICTLVLAISTTSTSGSTRGVGRALKTTLILWICIGSTLMLLSVPNLGSLLETIGVTLNNARTPGPHPLSGLQALVVRAPIASVFVAISALAVGYGALVRRRGRSEDVQVPALLFVGLGILALGSALISKSTDAVYPDGGFALRNAYPCALFLPFGVAIAKRLLGSRLTIGFKTVATLTTLVLLGVTVGGLTRKSAWVTQASPETAAAYEVMNSRTDVEGRIAFWNGFAVLKGEPSFHHGANDLAGHPFDQEVLERYPRYDFFRLLEAMVTIGNQEPSRFSKLGQPFIERWESIFGEPPAQRPGRLFAGDPTTEKIELVAFPLDSFENATVEPGQVVALIEDRFGDVTVTRQEMLGYEWFFVRIQEPSTPRSSSALQGASEQGSSRLDAGRHRKIPTNALSVRTS